MHWRRRIADTVEPKQLDLCRYMRTVLIYVPGFYLIVALVTLLGGLAVLILAPIWVPIWLLARYTRWWQWCGKQLTRFSHWLDRHEETWVPWVFGLLIFGFLVWIIFLLAREAWWMPFATLAGFVVGIALLTGLIVAGRSVYEHRKVQRGLNEGRPQHDTPKNDREPSLLWAWIKAKKKKICPLIQVKGEHGGEAPARQMEG
jgi:hypothetical protein